ncbi:monocarboxylate transporter 12-like [Glandiceps talaboti]
MRRRKSSYFREQPEVLDGGFGWFIVLATSIVVFFCLAVNASLGPFFVEFRQHFQESASKTSWISALVSFLTLAMGPLANKANNRFGCRAVVMFAGILGSVGFIISSFATSIYILYFSLGILVGVSNGLMFSPSVAFIGQYFKRRHALANGLGFAGVGIGIIVLPPLFQKFIDLYGWRGALLVLAAMELNVCVSAAIYRKPKRNQVQTRLNNGNTTKPLQGNNLQEDDDVVSDKTCVRFGCNVFKMLGLECSLLCESYRYAMLPYVLFVMGFGYYSVVVHLLPRARVKGIDAEGAAFLVSIFGIASLIGRFAHGGLLHTLKFVTGFQLCIGSTVLCGVCTCLSGLAGTFETMTIYCVMLGLTSGTFLPVVPVAITEFLGTQSLGAAYPLVNVFMGIGGVMGPPAAGWLYDVTDSYDVPFYVSGGLFISTVVTLFMEPCLRKLDDQYYESVFKPLPKTDDKENNEVIISNTTSV